MDLGPMPEWHGRERVGSGPSCHRRRRQRQSQVCGLRQGYFVWAMAKRAGPVGFGKYSAYEGPFTATGGCVAIDAGLPGSRYPWGFRLRHMPHPFTVVEMVTVLWSFCGTAAIALAAVCGWLWLIERRDRASLMLCLLGVAAAGTALVELGLMRSATAAEFAAWHHWIQGPIFLGYMAVVLFAHHYLGTGRWWLLWP